MEENENALKHFYDQKLLDRLAKVLAEVYPAYDRKKLVGLMPQLQALEMKPRVQFIRNVLRDLLPADYSRALKILLKAMKTGKLNTFDLWPFTEFVQTYGLDEVDLSLAALAEMTPEFTAEWAVRPFIRLHHKKTMKFLGECARSPNEHLRRWASEGSRPRLPWGERLHDFVKDPTPTLSILERLKFDEALYVRKSVSNHLNDIAKDHPELVIKILGCWQKEAKIEHAAKIDWIVHRSLRTLIKNGHAGALKLIGVSTQARVQLVDLKIKQKKIRLGERLDFSFTVRSLSKKPQKLVIDYIIHFVKSNQKTSPKVFKLRTFELTGQSSVTISKSHAMKKITTREYYSGVHRLEIQVNGKVMAKKEWTLAV
jgi:3-methyladenine DNA glycosylase AlkC